MRFLMTAFFTAALSLPASTVLAQATQSAIKRAEASRVVFDIGLEQRDALMVLAAAKLRSTLNLTPADRTPDGGTSDETGSVLNPEQMLQFAYDFAASDPLLLGVIEDAAAETTKGVTGGPVFNTATIAPKKTDTYSAVPFDAGAYAEIYVEAKDSSDLNLTIRDAQGRLVCSDTDTSAIAYCGWQPRTAGDFSINVQNMSGRSVQYSLITN